MAKIYCVIREERNTEYIYVEAESKKEAITIAEQKDSMAWRNNQDYNAEITAVDIIKNENELRGKYIETQSNSYIFGDKNK